MTVRRVTKLEDSHDHAMGLQQDSKLGDNPTASARCDAHEFCLDSCDAAQRRKAMKDQIDKLWCAVEWAAKELSMSPEEVIELASVERGL